MFRVNELKERSLGVGVGQYGSRRDFFTTGQPYATNASVLYNNFFDRGVGTNFNAFLTCK